jgi:hypothetical protein
MISDEIRFVVRSAFITRNETRQEARIGRNRRGYLRSVEDSKRARCSSGVFVMRWKYPIESTNPDKVQKTQTATSPLWTGRKKSIWPRAVMGHTRVPVGRGEVGQIVVRNGSR